MKQTDFNDPQNDERAQGVISAIERFVNTFNSRAPDLHAKEVLYSSKPLDGKKIGQAPERFIDEYLVQDVAEALGYEYRPQPKGFDGLEDDIPDFTVTNTDVTVIGELKKPNLIERARSESVQYLDQATNRPLVGIATDGLTWVMHSARVGEDPSYYKQSPLRRTIRNIAREQSSERSPRLDRTKLRRDCFDFVDSFGIEELPK